MVNDLGASLASLKNDYFALRHGQSKANEQAIIVSDPSQGTSGYGLTATGREQVKTSLENAPACFNTQIKIVSSDFLRARETAAVIASGLSVSEPVCYSENLRERFFGVLDGGADNRYEEVWKLDGLDENHSTFGVESAASVVARTLKLVHELETEHCGCVVLLVAHGDVLQFLQTAFKGVSPKSHRQFPPLQVAEIRPLTVGSPRR